MEVSVFDTFNLAMLMGAKSSPQTGRLAIWGAVALAIAVALIWRASQPDLGLAEALDDKAVNKKMAVLELEPLTGNGKSVSLDTVKGKVVLLNYWSTDCDICMRELPHIVELWNRYRGRPDVLFLSVSASGESRENVPVLKKSTEELLKAKSFAMPTYADSNGVTQEAIADLFEAPEIEYPATIMIDRKGIVRAVWRGYRNGDERSLEQMLSKLLAEN